MKNVKLIILIVVIGIVSVSIIYTIFLIFHVVGDVCCIAFLEFYHSLLSNKQNLITPIYW